MRASRITVSPQDPYGALLFGVDYGPDGCSLALDGSRACEQIASRLSDDDLAKDPGDSTRTLVGCAVCWEVSIDRIE